MGTAAEKEDRGMSNAERIVAAFDALLNHDVSLVVFALARKAAAETFRLKKD